MVAHRSLLRMPESSGVIQEMPSMHDMLPTLQSCRRMDLQLPSTSSDGAILYLPQDFLIVLLHFIPTLVEAPLRLQKSMFACRSPPWFAGVSLCHS